LTSVRFIKNGVLGVGSSGVIRFVYDLDEVRAEEEDPRTARPRQPVAVKPNAADLTQDDDRSATPVNDGRQMPRHAARQHDDVHDDQVMLPPPAMEGNEASRSEYDRQVLVEKLLARHSWRLVECETVVLNEHSFLAPGFIDTHVHAPQIPNLGLGQQYELLEWLERITFPREKKFEDPLYARKTYDSVVQRMLDSGTTCAAIYATLHEEATMILAHICNERGMRAFVGKCQMDRNAPLDYKEKNSAASMESTKRFINYCRNLKPYGTPLKDGESDPLTSSGSIEMDRSIARLSATMKSIMDEHIDVNGSDKENDDDAKPNVQSSEPRYQPQRRNTGVTESSVASTTYTSSAASEGMHRQSSMGSRTSSSAHGHNGRRSISSSGRGTPRRQKDIENANALVQPILTPRFAIACSDALLASISALLSRDATLRIQTHLSENAGEIEYTKELFPFCESYTDVYDHFSLLSSRTILAHAIHLSDDEMSLIARRRCGISHCPTSNLNLRSGASRLGVLLNKGIKVGLGTDMSGGFGMSMLAAIRDASIVAKVVQFSKEDQASAGEVEHVKDAVNSASKHDFCKGPLPVATLFYLATLGGAEVCDVADRVGSLDVGKEFDAILFNCDNSNPNLYIEDDDDLPARLEKTLFCADDRNIASVFVRGRVVGGSAPIG
jgi:cytosine/adenosine deaminase-related metal-dependent hydrolase